MALVIDQLYGFKPFNRSQRCKLQSLTQLDYTLFELTHSLKQAFEVANIHRSFSTPCFPLATRSQQQLDEGNPRVEIIGGHGCPRLRALVVEAAIAMASGINLLPLSSGLGGAYLLRSKNGDNIAIAKPIDEEALTPNSLKGYGGLMKHSIRVGGTGIRELAAYLLDHGGFAGVPPTALVKICNPVGLHVHKIASLQQFVHHDFDAGELGPSVFPITSVHRIGIFDIRLLNLDRHAGNILVKKKKNDEQDNHPTRVAKLVPIDHGLCLPEWLDDPYFEWLHWPQASIPFSENELEYIFNLDPYKDAQLLRTELPSLRESSIRVLIICTIFLKQGASHGLCLADIGKMMTRELCNREDNLSVLENLCAKAKACVVNTCNDYGEKNNEKKTSVIEEKEEDADIFEFDFDVGIGQNAHEEVMNLPQLLQCPHNSKPRTPRFSSVRSMPRLHDSSSLYEETRCDYIHNKYAKSGINREDWDIKKQGISVGDMSEDEWGLFLECLQKNLLPKVFST